MKTESHRFLLLVFFLYASLIVYSQTTPAEKLFDSFEKYRKSSLQEKLYLQTDKPYYNAGERIWLKAYLVNATTLRPEALSRFVYVELVNVADSVVSRVKIKKDSVGFAGYIDIDPEKAESGTYELRAYTSWMQNSDPDFFFHKRIQITNSIDDRVKCNLNFGEPVNSFIPLKLVLSDSRSVPFVDQSVTISFDKSASLKSIVLKTNSKGEINTRIPAELEKSGKNILAVMSKTPVGTYNHHFVVPTKSGDFDVQFFPESGNMLQNTIQVVAFKAINSSGYSTDVAGKIYDETNTEICDIESNYKGMGRFSMLISPQKKFYALLKNKSTGVEKRFELPASLPNGVSLQINSNRGKLLYSVNATLPDTAKLLYLTIHVRGFLYVVRPVFNSTGQINTNELPEGINTASVVDLNGNVYCERLFYVQKKRPDNFELTTDKKSYSRREKVTLTINMEDSLLIKNPGSYSISVTDSKYVVNDTLSDNIRTNLLLTSDLKGYIETPVDYFMDDKIPSAEKLNLLMLTQGWRRFDISRIIRGEKTDFKYYIELGQVLSGKVLNLFNKPSVKCDVVAFSNYKHKFLITKTDSLGRFLIDGIEFPDSTTFALKARKPKSITDVEIVPDKDDFASSKMFVPYITHFNNEVLDEYALISKDKYFRDGGMRVINLSELTVTAKSRESSSAIDPMYSGADNTITASDLEKYPGMNVLEYLSTYPGIVVNGDNVSIRGSLNSPMFVLDGFETEDIEDIKYISTTDIEAISVFKGASAAIFGVSGGNGVIAISLKKGVVVKQTPPVSLAVITPLGYQKTAEFYSPKYETKEQIDAVKPDLRTTIYWNSHLVPDSKGQISLEFYTADASNSYDWIFEGVAGNGTIIHRRGQIMRTY